MSKNVHDWYCMVPKCKNTSISTPDKQFVSVPKDASVRKDWCDAINRSNKQNIVLSCKTTRYCCEDHFNLPNDMENFVKHKILSFGNRQLKPKKGVLPHIFDCQYKSTKAKGRKREEKCSGSSLKSVDKAMLPVGSHSSAMENPDTESVSIKTKPGIQEAGICEMPDTYIVTDISIIKQKCLESSEITYRTEVEKATNNLSTVQKVTIKVEPGPSEENQGGVSRTKIDIDHKDIKKECLERSESVLQMDDIWTKENEKQDDHERNSTKSNQCEDLVNSKSRPKFSCSYCDYICSRKTYLMNHMKAHNQENTLACSECNYLCSRKARLKKHSLTHTLEKPFSCSYCSYVSSEKSHLKRHMLTHGGEKEFSCPECAYTSSLKSNLKRHIAATHIKKVFSCSKCDYSCSQKSVLKDHTLTHSEKKLYQCPNCNYSSSQRFNLSTHMLTHSGLKPFSCSECDSAFSNRTNLNNHFLIHSGDKPFACPDCNYISARLSTLKSHILTHRGR